MLELADDRAAGLLLPLPRARQEGVATEVFLGLALGGELPLEHHVNRDRRVVGAGEPERVEAVHALHAHEHVLQRHVERVTPVERPGHVRRWHHDRERLALRVGIGAEVAALSPEWVPALLDRRGIVSVGDAAGRRAAHSSTGPAAARRHRAPPRWKVSAQGVCSAVAATDTVTGYAAPSAASHAASGLSVDGSRRRIWMSGTSLARLLSSPDASASKSCATVARSSRCQALSWRPALRTTVPLSGAARNTSSASVCPSHPGVRPR